MAVNKRKLKIVIFDDDPHISSSFKKLLEFYGYSVLAYPDPTSCPLYKDHQDTCAGDSPCVDVLISDIRMPHVSGIDFFSMQKNCGCKILPQNRALMSSDMTPEQEGTVSELGCVFFRKPFKTSDVLEWLDECATRSLENDSSDAR